LASPVQECWVMLCRWGIAQWKSLQEHRQGFWILTQPVCFMPYAPGLVHFITASYEFQVLEKVPGVQYHVPRQLLYKWIY
jgi:hypothetical protein